MGLIDSFGRSIEYIRVSVTDRCNYRCHYCRPPKGIELNEHDEILTLEEIARLVRLFTELGVTRVRLTGGEPLLRRNVLTLIQELGALPELDDLSLSTNAHLLAPMAQELKAAGVTRVNISLDSLNQETFDKVPRGGDVTAVLAGIDAALAADLTPVKVNMVVMGGVNDHEIVPMVEFAMARGVLLRFIETMPVGEAGRDAMGSYVPADAIFDKIRARFGGEMIPTRGGRGFGPARYFKIEGAGANVGVISALSQHFCEDCNRVRLTSRGSLALCLGREDRVDLRSPLRQGASDDAMKELIREAVTNKPKRHAFSEEPEVEPAVSHRMSALGG